MLNYATIFLLKIFSSLITLIKIANSQTSTPTASTEISYLYGILMNVINIEIFFNKNSGTFLQLHISKR